MALRDMGISEVTNLDGAAGSTSYNGPEATGLQALWLVVTINQLVRQFTAHTHLRPCVLLGGSHSCELGTRTRI